MTYYRIETMFYPKLWTPSYFADTAKEAEEIVKGLTDRHHDTRFRIVEVEDTPAEVEA